jgi:hypothetical protein
VILKFWIYWKAKRREIGIEIKRKISLKRVERIGTIVLKAKTSIKRKLEL